MKEDKMVSWDIKGQSAAKINFEKGKEQKVKTFF